MDDLGLRVVQLAVVVKCGVDRSSSRFPQLNDIVFRDDSGSFAREIVAGGGRALLTNMLTGESVAVNVSGASVDEATADGGHILTLRGSSLLFYRPESLTSPPLVPSFFLFVGERVLTIDGAGNRSVMWHGRFVDLCAELAG